MPLRQGVQQKKDIRIPKTLAGVDLSEKQQAYLREDKTVYVKGLKDKMGQEYNAYIKVNLEKVKLDFYKFNLDIAKEKAKKIAPTNERKTQVQSISRVKPMKQQKTWVNL